MTSPKDPRKRISSRVQYRPEQVGSVKNKRVERNIGMMALRIRIQWDTMFDTIYYECSPWLLLTPQEAKSLVKLCIHAGYSESSLLTYVAKYHNRILS